MAKKKKGDGITFAGMSSNEVTGSCYHIQFAGKQILLECGLYQASSNDYLDSYKINSKKFPFKPSEILYIFVEHCHIDHNPEIAVLANSAPEALFLKAVTIPSMAPTILGKDSTLNNLNLSNKSKPLKLPALSIADVDKICKIW